MASCSISDVDTVAPQPLDPAVLVVDVQGSEPVRVTANDVRQHAALEDKLTLAIGDWAQVTATSRSGIKLTLDNVAERYPRHDLRVYYDRGRVSLGLFQGGADAPGRIRVVDVESVTVHRVAPLPPSKRLLRLAVRGQTTDVTDDQLTAPSGTGKRRQGRLLLDVAVEHDGEFQTLRARDGDGTQVEYSRQELQSAEVRIKRNRKGILTLRTRGGRTSGRVLTNVVAVELL